MFASTASDSEFVVDAVVLWVGAPIADSLSTVEAALTAPTGHIVCLGLYIYFQGLAQCPMDGRGTWSTSYAVRVDLVVVTKKGAPK